MTTASRLNELNHAENPARELLERLGFQFERMIRLLGDQEEIKLFAWEAA